jgi:hypothetical protein
MLKRAVVEVFFWEVACVYLFHIFSCLTLERRYLLEEISVWLLDMNLETWNDTDIFNI